MNTIRVCKKAYHRKGYTRKSGVRVKPASVSSTCYQMVDLGAAGHGKKLFTVKKGRLGKYGYHTGLSVSKRHVALKKADKAYGTDTLWRMLHAQVILRKREQPDIRKIFEKDRNWVKRNLMSHAEALALTRPARLARQHMY